MGDFPEIVETDIVALGLASRTGSESCSFVKVGCLWSTVGRDSPSQEVSIQRGCPCSFCGAECAKTFETESKPAQARLVSKVFHVHFIMNKFCVFWYVCLFSIRFGSKGLLSFVEACPGRNSGKSRTVFFTPLPPRRSRDA